ncbi:MAG TPA: 23S rRNA (uracil(1939)-C(5))-methyltransferase RlmD [Bacteroidales bacterium]|nr:23S rRNA (uracil(1939)-C(5))-methyltransferase RlmD [Bacteroidales bacterium]HRW94795.1 23S rRNA (uracil(1939)-C(5))-methyltransferase RlmD [Bacteroidales bacterium]
MPRKETITTSLKDVELTHFHSGGRACSREKYYVSGGIPGERVEIVSQRGKGFRSGTAVNILRASEDKTAPFCVHAGICGGCPWQHMKYDAQLRWKRDILERALDKYGIRLPAEGVPDTAPSPLQKGYRNRVEYTFEAGKDGKQNIMGFHQPGDLSSVFDCTECFLLPEGMHTLALGIKETALEQGVPFYRFEGRTGLLRNLTLRCTTTGDLAVIAGFTRNEPSSILPFFEVLATRFPAVTSWAYTVWDPCSSERYYNPEYHHVTGNTHLEEKSGALRFQYGLSSFYQPNPLQASRIFNHILKQAEHFIKEHDPVYDLYTGVGTIALTLAGKFKNSSITGIEGNQVAVRDAINNASLNKTSLAEFIAGDILRTFTPSFIALNDNPSLVLLDPPRSGTLTEIKKTILAAQPAGIIYLSCNPVSLAWDLKQLTENGYRLTAIQPFDMFPHTHHVETLAVCRKES